jgi:hypothetical protein
MLSTSACQKDPERLQQCGWAEICSARSGIRVLPCKLMISPDPANVIWPVRPILGFVPRHEFISKQEELEETMRNLRGRFSSTRPGTRPGNLPLSSDLMASDHREGIGCDSFVLEVTAECLQFSPRKLKRSVLAATIGFEWALPPSCTQKSPQRLNQDSEYIGAFGPFGTIDLTKAP